VASAGSNKLWVSKNTVGAYTANKLYSYTDVLAAEGPTLVAPADGYSDPVNTVTGKANEIAFSWERLSNGDEWKLYIAYDEAFTELVSSITKSGPGSDTPTIVVPVGPDRSGTNDPAGSQVNFMPGETYYWRVKAANPLYSPYSEARSFTIQPGVALVPSIGSPVNGGTVDTTTPAFSWSPVSGATQYEFELAVSTNFRAAIFKTTLSDTGIRPAVKLDEGMTYFWRVRASAPVVGDWSTIANFQVAEAPAPPAPAAPPVVVEQVPPPAPIAPAYIWAIIIIGAVLVIAVIVLIVRTRRTV
jgi:hypothetical protein